MRNWMDDLRLVPKEKVLVIHNPMTSRYGVRASRARERILVSGETIGYVDLGIKGDLRIFEIVVWTEPRNRGDFGWYSCFRIEYEAKKILPQEAQMFCFYDGQDEGKLARKKGFKTKQSARSFMRLMHPEYTEV